MEVIKKEKFLTGSTSPIYLEGAEIIISQMKKYICKILLNNGHQNTGFFCKIPYPDQKHLLPSLVTCNFIIKEEDLKEGNIIHLSLNDDREYREIKITNTRKIYTNEKFNVTFLEIEPDDKINNFLEIDPNIFKPTDIIKNIYPKSSVYILHYLKGNKIACSSGLLQELSGDNIQHLCNTDSGSSGAPILSLESFKIIGIHIGTTNNKEFNKGIFLKSPIVEFIQSNIGH